MAARGGYDDAQASTLRLIAGEAGPRARRADDRVARAITDVGWRLEIDASAALTVSTGVDER